jgi:hypothetical protein
VIEAGQVIFWNKHGSLVLRLFLLTSSTGTEPLVIVRASAHIGGATTPFQVAWDTNTSSSVAETILLEFDDAAVWPGQTMMNYIDDAVDFPNTFLGTQRLSAPCLREMQNAALASGMPEDIKDVLRAGMARH